MKSQAFYVKHLWQIFDIRWYQQSLSANADILWIASLLSSLAKAKHTAQQYTLQYNPARCADDVPASQQFQACYENASIGSLADSENASWVTGM